MVLFFFTLWLGVLGGSLTISIGVLGGSIGPTNYCQNSFVPTYAWLAYILLLVFDTLVFAAITWRLAQNARLENPNLSQKFKIAIFGKHLPSFSKALLQDGQMYYL